MYLNRSTSSPPKLLAFFLALLLTSSNLGPASASPIDFGELEERAPAKDQYPNAETISEHYVPFAGPSVFFSNAWPEPPTADQRNVPDRFAATIGGRTVRNAFGNQPDTPGVSRPDRLYTDRWLGQDDGRIFYKEFAKRFSIVFAQKASGVVYVLLRATGGAFGPRSDSVWTVYERPALEGNTAVTKIVMVNPDTFAQSDLWVRPAKRNEGETSRNEIEVKRDGIFSLDWASPADGPYWLSS